MKTLIHSLAILTTLLTATGVFVHDARIDKITSSKPLAAHSAPRQSKWTTSDLGLVEPHTHPEKANNTLSGFSYQTPTYPPREQKLKKYLMQNIEPRGRHAFDNYNLPIVG